MPIPSESKTLVLNGITGAGSIPLLEVPLEVLLGTTALALAKLALRKATESGSSMTVRAIV
jgi:hypothetical protein